MAHSCSGVLPLGEHLEKTSGHQENKQKKYTSPSWIPNQLPWRHWMRHSDGARDRPTITANIVSCFPGASSRSWCFMCITSLKDMLYEIGPIVISFYAGNGLREDTELAKVTQPGSDRVWTWTQSLHSLTSTQHCSSVIVCKLEKMPPRLPGHTAAEANREGRCARHR